MKTRITELFGIKYPIILAGMNWATTPKLVAAVSNAGGLGMLGAAAYSKEGLKEAIAEIRSLTDKPFAANLTLLLPGAKGLIQTVLEAKVPIVNLALGRITEVVTATREYGGKVLATVAMLRHALYYERDGADALVVTGYEAAAHSGNVGGLALIPAIASKVKIPIVAAGGFSDGRGLAAALDLGADAISLGTRFALTTESAAHGIFKRKCLEATEEDTILSDRFDGVNCRVLKTKRAEDVARRRLPLVDAISSAMRFKKDLNLSLWEVIKGGIRTARGEGGHLTDLPILSAGLAEMERAIEEGDEEHGLFLAGQACGGINDILSCQELIERIVAEAEEVAEATRRKFHPS
ncbi:NAD(P)H-dependent flavin oxidoreductase [Chloroflexota bacterium]